MENGKLRSCEQHSHTGIDQHYLNLFVVSCCISSRKRDYELELASPGNHYGFFISWYSVYESRESHPRALKMRNRTCFILDINSDIDLRQCMSCRYPRDSENCTAFKDVGGDDQVDIAGSSLAWKSSRVLFGEHSGGARAASGVA